MQKKIKVLVVDDSAFMRKVISDLLEQAPQLSVVATARDGQDALLKINQYKPDVITLDVEMPVLDGLETLKKIMMEYPLPVVMVSSTTKQGTQNTVLAFEYGAVDFVAKPSGAISLDFYKVKEELITKVVHASKINMKTILPKKIPLNNNKQVTQAIMKKSLSNQMRKIIAIGTSTGGPKALQQVLTKIPKHIHAPIVIVQHMPPGFTASLANRLNMLSEIHVKEACDGEVLENGVAYIAPGGYHLKVKRLGSSLVFQTDISSPYKGHRPSVDIMYDSLAKLKNCHMIAVIMTGMGADGSEGLTTLKKESSCYAIAESETTAVVFGMPKAAIRTSNVDEVVDLHNITDRIMQQF